MLRALWNGASGMTAQQAKIDLISNNIANINTTAYKRQQANFSDLLYQNVAKNQPIKLKDGQVEIQEGSGVKINASKSNFTQGVLQETGNDLDIAIAGEGFLEVQQPNGELAYTRAGNLKVSEGYLCTSNGWPLNTDIQIPDSYQELKITQDGTVTVKLNDGTTETLGYIPLIKISNPAALKPIGSNCFASTENSGEITEEMPGEAGMGIFKQGYLEGSNVDYASEVTEMIITQRAYQLNSKSIQTADEMWSIANNLRK